MWQEVIKRPLQRGATLNAAANALERFPLSPTHCHSKCKYPSLTLLPQPLPSVVASALMTNHYAVESRIFILLSDGTELRHQPRRHFLWILLSCNPVTKSVFQSILPWHMLLTSDAFMWDDWIKKSGVNREWEVRVLRHYRWKRRAFTVMWTHMDKKITQVHKRTPQFSFVDKTSWWCIISRNAQVVFNWATFLLPKLCHEICIHIQ